MAPVESSYLSEGADPLQMDDLKFRLAHLLWRGGQQLATSEWLTKKQIAHALQAILPGDENEQKLLELGVKGDVAAVAKGRSKEQLGGAVVQWAKTMASTADLLRRTRVVVKVLAPLTPQAIAAANAETAALDGQQTFVVKLRATVVYRELRDVDMQLANPLAPNNPAADKGE